MSEYHISTQVLHGNALHSGKIYTARQSFTRPPGVTNIKSGRKMIVRWRTRRLAEIEHSQNHFCCNCALFRLFNNKPNGDFYQALLKLAFSPLVHESSQKYSVRASITQTIVQSENVRRGGGGGNKSI